MSTPGNNQGYPQLPPYDYQDDGRKLPTAPPEYIPTAHPVYPGPNIANTMHVAAPAPTSTGHTVVLAQVQEPRVVVVAPMLGIHRTRTTCHNCQHEIETKIEKRNGIVPWISCAAICVLGGVCGCCLIPFCIDSCRDVDHSCTNCGAHLGTHKAFF